MMTFLVWNPKDKTRKFYHPVQQNNKVIRINAMTWISGSLSTKRASLRIAPLLHVSLFKGFENEAPISGHFESGRLAAIMGPSGCGKTTLLEAWLKRGRGRNSAIRMADQSSGCFTHLRFFRRIVGPQDSWVPCHETNLGFRQKTWGIWKEAMGHLISVDIGSWYFCPIDFHSEKKRWTVRQIPSQGGKLN